MDSVLRLEKVEEKRGVNPPFGANCVMADGMPLLESSKESSNHDTTCPSGAGSVCHEKRKCGMQYEIVRAGLAHRLLLRQLFELYAHEFSAWNDVDVDQNGRFTPDDFLLDGWRRRDGAGRYLLKVNGQWAGFAFVERGSYLAPGHAANWLMDEFFILMKYRRRGLGRWFALELLRRMPGEWEIGQIPQNISATAFWRTVASHVSDGSYEERFVENEMWHGPVQLVHVRDGMEPLRLVADQGDAGISRDHIKRSKKR